MVTDSLQNLEQYRGLHKNMDTVIDFLKKCDLTALPDGKTVIDGERLFVNVMEADLREAVDRQGRIYRYISGSFGLRTCSRQKQMWRNAGGRKLCFIPAGIISQTKLQKRITHTCEKSSC